MGFLSKVIGSITGSNQIEKGYNQAAGASREMFGKSEAALNPFIDFGKQGLSGLNSLMADPNQITQLPFYQFLLNQGLQGTQRMAGAKGRFFSGATEKELTDYSSGLASKSYGDEFSRRFNIAQLGAQSAGALAGAAGGTGNTLANLAMTKGQDLASAQGSLLNLGLQGFQLAGMSGMGPFSGLQNLFRPQTAGAFGGNNAGLAGGLAAGGASLFGSSAALGEGLAAGAAMFSDRRLKTNIVRVGDHPTLDIGIYEYDMFGKHTTGVMADEVLEVMPEAIIKHSSGYLMVDYSKL